MAIATGEIAVGDAQGSAAAINRRAVGYGRWLGLIVGIAVVVGLMSLLSWLDSWCDVPVWLYYVGLAAIVLGVLPGLGWALRKQAVRNVSGQLRARGIEGPFPVRVEVTPEALDYSFGFTRSVTQWEGVTELFLSKGFWIFMVLASPVYVPQRFFADASAERAFVTEALSCMTEGARARSKDALKFAGG